MDFCILSFNQPTELKNLLKSFSCFDKCNGIEKNIYLVDNGSNVNLDFIPKQKFENINFQYKFLDENYGVAKGWNEVIKMGKSNILLIFNDDYEITSPDAKWLKLVDDYLSLNFMHILSFPNNDITIFKEYNSFIRGEKGRYTHNFRLFAFTRKLFDLLGGFDEKYFFAYEDTDFNMSCLKAGGKLIEFGLPYVALEHHRQYSPERTKLQERGQSIGGNIFYKKFPTGV